MLSAARRMLLVHAHPDDETLWTGGVIARYATEGVDVALVTCTLGEQGEIILPELAGLGSGHADQLGGYRLGELRAACTALGVSEQRFLGGLGRWRDSGMMVEPGGRASLPADLHPRAFAGGPLTEQVSELVGVPGAQPGQLGQDDLALLAQRAGHQRDVNTLGGVPRDHPAGPERLVVWVRVHEQHPPGRAEHDSPYDGHGSADHHHLLMGVSCSVRRPA